MRWKRRKGLPKWKPYVAPPMPEPISVERAVEEGALIARSALATAARNHVILTAVRDGLPFDRDEVARFVRTELQSRSR